MARIDSAPLIDRLMFQLQKPNMKHKTVFFRLLAVAQKAWLGIREALTSILQSEQHYGMKIILKDLIEDVNQWFPFAKAIEWHKWFFLWDEIELVRAAEGIGNMPDTLNNIALELENFQKIRGKVKWALTYPLMLLTFAIGAVAVLLVKVIPTFVWLFEWRELPAITQYMLTASAYLQSNWYKILIIIIWVVTVFNLLYKYFLPFKILIDSLILKIPVLKDVVKTFYLYRFSKVLADFYRSWVNPVVSLEQMAAIFDNYLYKKKAMDIRTDLEAWFWFADSMEWSHLFDPILVQIVLVWERTGNIDEVLLKMASFYDNELETKIKTLMAMIEPILMSFIAVIIWWIVASIFLPMADLVNSIT